tara:strand:- start:1348 stop:1710 length:363 start_codon:yes stop_codon:yes gene_type:complete
MTDKSDTIKEKLLIALEKSLGVVTTACKNVGVHRSTYYEWYNKDEGFKKEVDSIQNVALDFAESQLHKQIQEGSTSATIFYLKTKGKLRGYQENQAIDINTSGEINVNFKNLISAIKDKE